MKRLTTVLLAVGLVLAGLVFAGTAAAATTLGASATEKGRYFGSDPRFTELRGRVYAQIQKAKLG